jgi:hypothetical protein
MTSLLVLRGQTRAEGAMASFVSVRRLSDFMRRRKSSARWLFAGRLSCLCVGRNSEACRVVRPQRAARRSLVALTVAAEPFCVPVMLPRPKQCSSRPVPLGMHTQMTVEFRYLRHASGDPGVVDPGPRQPPRPASNWPRG